jgi:CheY-like chemotaxis protein
MTTPQHGGTGAVPLDERRQSPAPLVLVADQDEQTREWCTALLTTAGFRVTRARTGFEAIVKASCLEPAVILVGHALPGFESWGAVKLLVLCPSTRHIPIVGLGAEEAGATAREAGCARLLPLPMAADSLLRTVEGVLQAALYEPGRALPAAGGLQATPS